MTFRLLLVVLVVFASFPSEGVLAKVVSFDTTDPGVSKPLDFWGVDQTWVSSNNMTQSIENLGLDAMDVVRIEFPMTEPLDYDLYGNPVIPIAGRPVLDAPMKEVLRAPNAKISLQPDNSKNNLGPWYIDYDGLIHTKRWVDAIVASINYVNTTYGYTVSDWAFIEVFNEPDWDWPEGSRASMAEIMAECRRRSLLDTIPLLGPSTLSVTWASGWYNHTRFYTDIGGTHVINGSMSQLINFIKQVHRDNKPFINPEIHNFLEVIIAAEYSDRPGEGGLFWGGVNPTEGRFTKACLGKRIAYATDAATWSAVCAYRDPEGRIWLFAGSNERHAFHSQWEFRCSNRDVFFDGIGPARSTFVTMGKHENHHIEVTWGDRNPRYVSQYLDHVGTQKRLAAGHGQLSLQGTDETGISTRWAFRPVGAFYTIDHVSSLGGSGMGRLAASPNSEAVILVPSTTSDDFSKWQLTQTRDAFYLDNVGRQRSGKAGRLHNDPRGGIYCVNSSNTQAIWTFSRTDENDTTPPAAPRNLTAITGNDSIQLDWADHDEWDFDTYWVYRKTTDGSDYEPIATGLNQSSYEDKSTVIDTAYSYVVRAVDVFGNMSGNSAPITMSSQTALAYDDFDAGYFNDGFGWKAGWQRTGAFLPSLQSVGANRVVQMALNAALTRTLTEAPYEGILSFKYDVDGLNAGDVVSLEVYDWVGKVWLPAWSAYHFHNGSDASATPDRLEEKRIDLSVYGVYIDQIRFQVAAQNAGAMLYIDDVQVFSKTPGQTGPEILYIDDMSSTNGWFESSEASNEDGDTTGGIRVVNEDRFQMNSWWNSARWTKIYRGTGHTIEADRNYTMRVHIKSHAGSKPVHLKFQNATESWQDIAVQSVTPTTDVFTEYTVSFTTGNRQNAQAWGDELGIAIDPGWWNNLSIDSIRIESAPASGTGRR